MSRGHGTLTSAKTPAASLQSSWSPARSLLSVLGSRASAPPPSTTTGGCIRAQAERKRWVIARPPSKEFRAG